MKLIAALSLAAALAAAAASFAFPARAERSIKSAWVSVGEQMATASTSFEARISSTDPGR